MRGNLTEVDFVGLVLRELAGTREHSLDSSTGQSILTIHNELVAITGDELHKHGIRALTSSEDRLTGVHVGVAGSHCSSQLSVLLSCRSESSNIS